MSQEIQKADPEFRKLVLISLVIFCAFATIGVLLLDYYLGQLQVLALTSLPTAAAKAFQVARVVFVLVGIGAVLASVYLAKLARQTLNSERFPPPQTRVINDTPIRRGKKARLYGWLSAVFALLLLFMGIAVPLRANKILHSVLDVKLRPDIETTSDFGF